MLIVTSLAHTLVIKGFITAIGEEIPKVDASYEAEQTTQKEVDLLELYKGKEYLSLPLVSSTKVWKRKRGTFSPLPSAYASCP